jgi:hypothetical protein
MRSWKLYVKSLDIERPLIEYLHIKIFALERSHREGRPPCMTR